MAEMRPLIKRRTLDAKHLLVIRILSAAVNHIADLTQFVRDLGRFLIELQNIDSSGGPLASPHNFHRGDALAAYDAEVFQVIPKIKNKKQQQIAEQLWMDAHSSQWERTPGWIHGDLAVGNILVRNGQLTAVIDFGQLAIGDPACDLAITWNFFTGASRDVFKEVIAADKNTWVRALAWTFWKTLCRPLPGTNVNKILLDVYADYQTHYC